MRMPALLLALCLSSAAMAADHGTGYIHQDAASALEADHVVLDEVALPARYDVRSVLPQIRDQGRCGSCWAFATTGALEGTIAVKEGRQVHLSEQELVSCNNEFWGCQGGNFAHSMQQNPGQTGAADFAYTASNSRCKSDLPVKEKIASWAFIGEQGKTPTTDQLKQALFQNGPLSVTVYANGAMQGYKGGLFTGCDGREETNHMVMLVGWDDQTVLNGHTGFWIVRNQWGASWGDKGYIYMPYGCSRIAEEAAAVFLK